MPDCDAACRKIIINTGNMAILAPQLAHATGDTPAGRSAIRLFETASTLTRMHAAAGLKPCPDDFTGCDEAVTLLEWIADPSKADAAKLDEWTAETYRHIANLAAGKFSTP